LGAKAFSKFSQRRFWSGRPRPRKNPAERKHPLKKKGMTQGKRQGGERPRNQTAEKRYGTKEEVGSRPPRAGGARILLNETGEKILASGEGGLRKKGGAALRHPEIPRPRAGVSKQLRARPNRPRTPGLNQREPRRELFYKVIAPASPIRSSGGMGIPGGVSQKKKHFNRGGVLKGKSQVRIIARKKELSMHTSKTREKKKGYRI